LCIASLSLKQIRYKRINWLVMVRLPIRYKFKLLVITVENSCQVSVFSRRCRNSCRQWIILLPWNDRPYTSKSKRHKKTFQSQDGLCVALLISPKATELQSLSGARAMSGTVWIVKKLLVCALFNPKFNHPHRLKPETYILRQIVVHSLFIRDSQRVNRVRVIDNDEFMSGLYWQGYFFGSTLASTQIMLNSKSNQASWWYRQCSAIRPYLMDHNLMRASGICSVMRMSIIRATSQCITSQFQYERAVVKKCKRLSPSVSELIERRLIDSLIFLGEFKRTLSPAALEVVELQNAKCTPYENQVAARTLKDKWDPAARINCRWSDNEILRDAH